MAQQLKSKFIKSDAIDGSKVKFSFGQAIRGINSLGQEVELFKLGSSNEALVKGQEIAFKSQVDSLQSALTAAEASFTAAITQEVSDRQSDVAAKLVEAKGYTDSEIEKLTHLAPAALNTFKELADKLAEDEGVVSSVISTVSGISADLATEVSNRVAAISAEQSARETADAALQSQLETAIANAVGNASGSLSGDLNAETSSRIAADNELDGKITTEKNRAESAENVLTSSINSEISRAQAEEATLLKLDGSRNMSGNLNMGSHLIVGVSTPTMGSHASNKSYVDGKESSITSAFQAADATITSSLNSEISRAQGAEAQVLADAKSYADSKGSWNQTYTAEQVLIEKNRAEAAEGVLTSSINTEKGRIDAILLAADADKDSFAEIVSLINSVDTTNDSAFASYVLSNDAALASEISRAQGAESTISSNLSSEISRAQGEEATLLKLDGSRAMTGVLNMGSHKITGLVTPTQNSDAAGKGYVDTQVSNEATARASAVSDVQSSLTSEISRAQAAEAQALVDAKAYADTKKSEALSYADAGILVEKNRAEAAEGSLSTRVGVLEAKAFNKMKIIIDTASELSYVDLDHSVVMNSMVVSVGRLMVHKGEDFSVSTVGGKTRLTWMGDFAVGGVEAIESGDVIFVTYMY